MKQARLQRIERNSFLLAALATLASLLFWDVGITLGVALGAGLAALNFYALRRLMQGLLREGGAPQAKAAMAVLLALKFGVLAAVIFFIIRFLPVSPLALLAGISVVVLSIFGEGLRSVIRGTAAQSE